MAKCLTLGQAYEVLQNAGLVLSSTPDFRLPTTNAEIFTDSRKVVPGSIFLAYRGVNGDGHRHLEAAASKGASLLVIEDASLLPPNCHTPYVVVKNGRFAWAYLESAVHGNPQKNLKLLAVTGTNGKTSTAWMIRALLKARGHSCLLIGTLGAWVGDTFRKTNHTTPDPDLLYALLAEARDQGIGIVIMEAASQSLLHGKLAPISFCGAAFTSFSRDHLDLHQTMEDYFSAKMMLFEKHLSPSARVVLSNSLPVAAKFDSLSQKDLWRYQKIGAQAKPGRSELPAYALRSCRVSATSPEGTCLEVFDDGQLIASGTIPYAGDFFVENFCAALLLTEKVLGELLPPDSWANLPAVPGRLERVAVDSQGCADLVLPNVLVDYAHTPDALEKALAAVRPLTTNKLVVVFGCGGDRDRGKRPQMGVIAATKADYVFVTSDNPRTESVDNILRDISEGLESAGGKANKTFTVIADRKRAIREAIASSVYGDVVLIAGKGHEDYQIIGTTSFPFDDREVARDALAEPLRWLVIGGGVSGLGAAQLLRKCGQEVRLSESKQLSSPMRTAFESAGVEVCEGGHSLDHLKNIKGVVVSPGVPESHLLMREAKKLSLRVLSEIDLAISDYKGRLIAITGTNGKSTTTVMIGHLLKKLGLNHALGGNLGDPPSAIKARGPLPEILVLELSSYQLEQSFGLKPDVSVFTSFSHDHMARHGSLKDYFAAKWKLLSASNDKSLSIVTAEVLAHATNFGLPNPAGRLVVAEEASVDVGAAGISEKHNRLNATFALLAVAKVTGKNPGDLAPLLKDFRGLPHRCEVIGTIKNKNVINDSKSTNVESTMVAVESQPEPVVLMMGGQGKGEPYSPLVKSLPRIARLVTFGASGDTIAAALASSVPTSRYKTLADALRIELPGFQNTPSILLFSPGCASFDEFKNYEHRGDFFKEACQVFLDSK